jgi:hypothetical protein
VAGEKDPNASIKEVMYGPYTKALFIYTSIVALLLLSFCIY